MKRLSSIRKHGMDFTDLSPDFFMHADISPTKLRRLMAVGLVGNDVAAVVFSPLGREALSIISMRRANRRERK